MAETRQAKRTPVTLKIKFKSETLDQFIERYSVDVSHGGIFIRTKDPLPVGTTLKFEFQLKDASPLIRGDGTVVWTREQDPSRAGVAPGMGVRFDRLPPDSQEVLDKILAQKASQGIDKASAAERPAPAFSDGPTRVAPTPLVAGLKTASQAENTQAARGLAGIAPPRGGFADERTDATPLPSPVPFHSDADDFPEEAFEEKTRVAVLDRALLNQTLRDDSARSDSWSPGGPAAAHVVDDDEPLTFAPPADETAVPIEDDDPAPLADDEPSVANDDPFQDVPIVDDEQAERAAAAARDELAARRRERERAAAAEAAQRKRDDSTDKLDRQVTVAAADDAFAPARRSSGGLIALLALLPIAGGAGAYWWTTTQAAGTAPPPPIATAAPSAEPAPTAEPALAEPSGGPAAVPLEEPADAEPSAGPVAVALEEPADPEPAAPAGMSVTVDSLPSGATAVLVGTDQQGSTPMVFEGLVAGTAYRVELSLEGYATQTLSFSPDTPPRRPVSLSALPRVLEINSTPAGAMVFVNGSRQRGVTPLQVALTGALARADAFEISVRKRGYVSASESVPAAAEFLLAGNVMSRGVSVELDQQPEPVATLRQPAPAARPPAAEPKPAAEPGATPAEPEPAAKPVAKPKPSEPEPTEPADPPIKDEGPTPDWMK